jgi:predicted membrane channel-forming protein YqfA (hemolysin III family)
MSPTEAVLFREVCYQMYWFMAIGLACVIFGIVMCSCNLPDLNLKRVEPVIEEES